MDWLNNLFGNKARKAEKNARIFLDYASATPVREEVRQVMEQYWAKNFYNPSAIYDEGVKVGKDVENYRARVAKLVGAGEKEVIFTASGTESVNLGILGAFEESKGVIKKPHIIISAIEHAAVTRSVEEVVRRGGEVSVVKVSGEGLVTAEAVKKLLKPSTFMVSIALANSEIGTVEPVSKIGRVVREFRKSRNSVYPLLHTDASAAVTYWPTALESLQCDLLTLDGSKICGPKGVGVLAVRRGVKIRPIIMGGGQERGLRAGTTNTALVAGFTVALELVVKEREKEAERVEKLRRQFIEQVLKRVPEVIVNGSKDFRLPNIISISIPEVLGEFMLLKLDKEGVMVSVGTACSLDERESGSPVLRAIGKPTLAEATLRFSLGKYTTESEIKRAAEIFCRVSRNVIK